jgi:glycosyltransferase involved in cell wall biosynthesis
VLSVFNEVNHLEEEIIRIQKSMAESRTTYQIIVVDDGSTDGSGEPAQRLDGVRAIRFGTNRGSGSARRYGKMERSRTVMARSLADV